jgi:GH15 family glucan-1,4-alpha-glucosidase
MELIVRFDYGSIVPWVRRANQVLLLTAGPDTLELTATVAVASENMKSGATFCLGAGDRHSFALNYRHSHEQILPAVDVAAALALTETAWRDWSDRCTYQGRWREPVMRSLITLKALTYKPTGGIVAAPTTSLPEHLGGIRNWDYRYCWLRDATFTLNSLGLPAIEWVKIDHFSLKAWATCRSGPSSEGIPRRAARRIGAG